MTIRKRMSPQAARPLLNAAPVSATTLTLAKLLLTIVVGVTLLGCAKAPQTRGRIAGLQEIADQAERNGAVRCAPRELAIAQSQLRFANIELEQGYVSKAKHHLWLAEPNARAALFLSPPEHCARREFVMPAGDIDGDGYIDSKDSCPELAENFNGIADEDGCPEDPDSDGDGIVDSKDACPLTPEDSDDYLDEDGCPELDNDLDTVLDHDDKCPNQPEDPDGYEDLDGCPDLDNDQDTVPDILDMCPNEIGSATKAPLGCPQKPALVVVTNCEVKITQQIHFEYNRAVIRPFSFPVLNAVAEVLSRNPSIKLEVQGHTDNRGGGDYNKKLSARRADAVKQYLVSQGAEPARLSSEGYGFELPIVLNDTDANRALNRRVQFLRTEGTRAGCDTPSK